MAIEFAGKARPIDDDGLQQATDVLGVRAAELWAVIAVETRGCGFLPDRRAQILFERHIFSRETNRRFDETHSGISNRRAGGYGAAGAHQYARLKQAIGLDRKAALRSASWGIGQVMGFNAEMVGYPDVEAMVADFSESEGAQLRAMANFIKAGKLDGALRTHDWARFARGYNGPNYRINNYDTRLAAAHQRLDRGVLPDLRLRAAQVYLMYLGYEPGPVDGVMGRFTRSAMNEFQHASGLAVTDLLDDLTLEALREAQGGG